MRRIIIREALKDTENSVIEVDRGRLFDVLEFTSDVRKNDRAGRLENRRTGNFKGKAFFLSEIFSWVLGKDNEDQTVLVPLEKV